MAVSIEQVGVILAAFDSNIDPIMKLVKIGALIIGLWIVYKSVMQLAQTARAGGQAQGHGGYAGALISFFIGVGLMRLPTLINSANESLFMAQVSPLSYNVHSNQLSDKANSMLYVILHFMQLVGLIAFIKGFMILNKVANGGGHDVTKGKGLAHIIGGVLAVNIFTTVNYFASSVGLDFQLSQ